MIISAVFFVIGAAAMCVGIWLFITQDWTK